MLFSENGLSTPVWCCVGNVMLFLYIPLHAHLVLFPLIQDGFSPFILEVVQGLVQIKMATTAVILQPSG